MQPPLLRHKNYDAPSVFTAENMLREARRQKSIPLGDVPEVCILDPDGDIAAYLLSTEQAILHPNWACYHTKLYDVTHYTTHFGIVPNVVGSSFAVLVAEELFASGCKLVISITSAGQIVPVEQPPYFVLIERALRDEGTSYHYLSPADFCSLTPSLLTRVEGLCEQDQLRILKGSTWTTDGPFRETEEAIAFALSEGILGVEMEAAALYAFAQARDKAVICFAHITNQMAQIEGDFEKGLNQGSHDALRIIDLAIKAWLG